MAVIETPEFLGAVKKLLEDEERRELVDYLSLNPTAGDLIQGAGGVRKLRFALEGRGKGGGARVIYFYHDGNMPVFLLTAYAKNRKDDISDQDRNDFKALAKILVESYRKPRNVKHR